MMSRMMSRIPLAATVLVTLALAGCAADGGDSASNASGAPSATMTTAGPGTGANGGPSGGAGTPSGSQSAPGTTNGDTLLIFTRQGGLAGTNDRLILRPDGSYTVQTRTGTRTGKLTAQELAAVKATLDATDFNKMPSVNDGGTVADGFTYSITYAGREITAEDGAVPPALQPVLGALSALLSK
jgi:hypothetical protein